MENKWTYDLVQQRQSELIAQQTEDEGERREEEDRNRGKARRSHSSQPYGAVAGPSHQHQHQYQYQIQTPRPVPPRHVQNLPRGPPTPVPHQRDPRINHRRTNAVFQPTVVPTATFHTLPPGLAPSTSSGAQHEWRPGFKTLGGPHGNQQNSNMNPKEQSSGKLHPHHTQRCVLDPISEAKEPSTALARGAIPAPSSRLKTAPRRGPSPSEATTSPVRKAAHPSRYRRRVSAPVETGETSKPSQTGESETDDDPHADYVTRSRQQYASFKTHETGGSSGADVVAELEGSSNIASPSRKREFNNSSTMNFNSTSTLVHSSCGADTPMELSRTATPTPGVIVPFPPSGLPKLGGRISWTDGNCSTNTGRPTPQVEDSEALCILCNHETNKPGPWRVGRRAPAETDAYLPCNHRYGHRCLFKYIKHKDSGVDSKPHDDTRRCPRMDCISLRHQCHHYTTPKPVRLVQEFRDKDALVIPMDCRFCQTPTAQKLRRQATKLLLDLYDRGELGAKGRTTRLRIINGQIFRSLRDWKLSWKERQIQHGWDVWNRERHVALDEVALANQKARKAVEKVRTPKAEDDEHDSGKSWVGRKNWRVGENL